MIEYCSNIFNLICIIITFFYYYSKLIYLKLSILTNNYYKLYILYYNKIIYSLL